MLDLWMCLGKWREQNFPRIGKVRVGISSHHTFSVYEHCRHELRICLNEARPFPLRASSAALDIPAPAISSPAGRRIVMVVPVVTGDKRWDGIGVTASDLILGSALTRQGYRVSVTHPQFPSGPPLQIVEKSDILGISLYEDLFPAVRSWSRTVGDKLPDWVAAGGPMVTLNPLPAVAHFPRGNLWIRGEAEGVFPKVLKALESAQLLQLKNCEGVLLIKQNLLMAWEFSKINRPSLPLDPDFDFSFIEPQAWKKGIEINLTRGCERTCIFCSRAQGNKLRRMPEPSTLLMLEKIREAMPPDSGKPLAAVLNINDDDILQDADYAARVFQGIHRAGFRLWGVQTSLSSVLNQGKPHEKVIDLLSRGEYFANGPLVWFGTDAFLPRRGKRLCKPVPSATQMERLFSLFQARNIRHHHYWISSDHISGWPEMTDELCLITRWWKKFPNFHILPHSPFLIPYPCTPLFAWVSQSPFKQQLRFREWMRSSVPCLDYPLVERVESAFEMLNNMLRGQSDGHHPAFLQSLQHRDPGAALETAHYFLRQERLRLEGTSRLDKKVLLSLDLAGEKLQAAILENRMQSQLKKTTTRKEAARS
ncbi:MAG: hypothetical protein JXA62_00485 [Candidatus Aminicenantes bacterium]|nr:hypothetical protein [Candidatus Aminicenantes bacterium]